MSFPRRRSFFLSFFFPPPPFCHFIYLEPAGKHQYFDPCQFLHTHRHARFGPCVNNCSAAHVLLLSVWISSADKLMRINVMDAAAHTSATAWGEREGEREEKE